MASNLGYASKTDIENYLLLNIDSGFNSTVDMWISAAELMANSYMGYTTASGILAEQITGEMTYGQVGTDLSLTIFPRKIPIISVSGLSLVKGTNTVTLNLTSGTTNKYNIPATADHIIYPSYELSISGSSIITSFADLRNSKFLTSLDYIAGYTTVPEDIRMATVYLASDMVMRQSNKEGLQSITQGRISKSYAKRNGQSDFVADAYEILKGYRIASRWV